jgi:SAM-dependent methyltransferase
VVTFRRRLRRILGDRVVDTLRSTQRGLMSVPERLIFGGEGREALLVGLLLRHYQSRFRRDWVNSPHPPHFWYHRLGWFRIGFDAGASASTYSRAFYSAEVIRRGDRVLDIGCGDGFITRRFLAERAGQIHALDIEPSAIRTAQRLNGGDPIEYFQSDATVGSFPAASYDVIVWDGAIGHFDPSTTNRMLEKIKTSLEPDGIFVGSESLGHEGGDHLQFWENLGELRAMLSAHFPYVELKELSMTIGMPGNEMVRREAYWRCSLLPDRLRELDWAGSELHDEGPRPVQ